MPKAFASCLLSKTGVREPRKNQIVLLRKKLVKTSVIRMKYDATCIKF